MLPQLIDPIRSEDKDILLENDNLRKVCNLCTITFLNKQEGKRKLEKYEKGNLPPELIVHLREAYENPKLKRQQLLEKYKELPAFMPESKRFSTISNVIMNISVYMKALLLKIFDMIVSFLKSADAKMSKEQPGSHAK